MRNWLVWKNVFRRLNLKNKIRFTTVVILLFLGLLFVSCERETQLRSLELEIPELICRDGQRIFEGRILSLAGIKTVTANIQTQKAQISYREQHISADEIKNHLLEFGFTINSVAGNAAARKRLPSCCLE